MRYEIRYDDGASKWAVIDHLSTSQTVGLHDGQQNAAEQAESEERRWRRFGTGTETFALIAN